MHWTHSSVCLFVLEEILIPAATAAAMKSTILTSFLLAATTAIHTALAYSPPLKITSMTTHQPIGSGSTNFYYINFAIQGIPSRRFSSSSSSAYCQISWGDNGWTNPQPYSIHVPTGTWMNCDSTPGSYDGTSAFQFQLFPYFSIGNFTVGVKQDLGRGRSVTGYRKINNGTSQFTCSINPTEYFPNQHASGDCTMPEGALPFDILVA